MTEGLTLSDSVDLSSSFAIEKIEKIVKDIEREPKTPENQAKIDELKIIQNFIEEHGNKMKEEFEKDRAPIPYSREKAIIIFIAGVICAWIIEKIIFG